VNAHELRELTNEELNQRLRESSESLFSLRVQTVTGELDDSHAIRRVRRMVARIRTLLRERQDGERSAAAGSE
jgi:large subunit ribosomal protein L29